jgi:hypothetical protein
MSRSIEIASLRLNEARLLTLILLSFTFADMLLALPRLERRRRRFSGGAFVVCAERAAGRRGTIPS